MAFKPALLLLGAAAIVAGSYVALHNSDNGNVSGNNTFQTTSTPQQQPVTQNDQVNGLTKSGNDDQSQRSADPSVSVQDAAHSVANNPKDMLYKSSMNVSGPDTTGIITANR